MTVFSTTHDPDRAEVLEQLVRFVLASNVKNEFDWLEWKRSLPLDGPEGRFKAALRI
ncbi:MAG: hypothetical protein H6518_10115 [Microthrixaceae bacterium]|nr:hypothetical protein [Microthrixaceae bacterium]